jgi:uncharacterized hydrophobic protein (TIGR00271 family)
MEVSMLKGFSTTLLPPQQRRSVDELTHDLDLEEGDSAAKRSAFWTMLTLSSIIAAAGVLADSTATVIGAMIIAPLATPILGVGLGIAKRDSVLSRHSLRYVVLGALLAISVGVIASILVPGGVNLLNNSQIAGRTSPGLTDLVAALATGVAGAVAMTRRDVASVLPGVAIAISLVPPLAVVGVCLGQGAFILATGAFVLFVSNLLALVLIGSLVFTVITQAGVLGVAKGASRRKTYITLSLLMVLIGVPLLANTASTILIAVWSSRVTAVADSWAKQEPGTVIQKVDWNSSTAHVYVLSAGNLPDTADLIADLEGLVPNGVAVVIDTSVGQEIDAGIVGGETG